MFYLISMMYITLLKIKDCFLKLQKNIKDHFDLNELYKRCKANPIRRSDKPSGNSSKNKKDQ